MSYWLLVMIVSIAPALLEVFSRRFFLSLVSSLRGERKPLGPGCSLPRNRKENLWIRMTTKSSARKTLLKKALSSDKNFANCRCQKRSEKSPCSRTDGKFHLTPFQTDSRPTTGGPGSGGSLVITQDYKEMYGRF